MMTQRLLSIILALSVMAAVCFAEDSDAQQPQQPRTTEDALAEEIDTFHSPGGLRAAIAKVAELADVTIEVDWRSLQSIGLSEETEVVLRTDHLTARRILELICAQVSPSGHPVRLAVDGPIVRVTADAAPRRGAVAGAAEAPAAREPGITLGQRADLTFEDVAFVDVVSAIQDISRIGVHVQWRALALSDVTRETLVTVNVPGLTLARTLNLLTEDLSAGLDKYSSVYWIVDDGLIRITTGRAINQQTRTRMYDVGDMLMTIPDFAAPRFDVGELISAAGGSSTDFWADTEDEDDEPTREETEQLLIDTVKDLLDADMWIDGGGKGSVRIVGNRLIVSQTRLGWLLMAQSR